uniref:Uncharacterized protein n=1 Tax=Chromera velia CCMP2878 TaxID=1169474 RepID=A0A0G4F6R5_9ALVE|eukprot:Cvel_15308.t1-p1 / transcript=Cvel_15308.t1 / gene=Cvel_15308 / organism=Chromera_velia_CCMP2878 / gene_product=hypothetical protein / transcript_product=hypothetical protein / location=Cvel_scaffold1124:34437-37623(-) / protein_length=690 / sequence_SO=supercontig / SO=protein_coding / is_pseudo=false
MPGSMGHPSPCPPMRREENQERFQPKGFPLAAAFHLDPWFFSSAAASSSSSGRAGRVTHPPFPSWQRPAPSHAGERSALIGGDRQREGGKGVELPPFLDVPRGFKMTEQNTFVNLADFRQVDFVRTATTRSRSCPVYPVSIRFDSKGKRTPLCVFSPSPSPSPAAAAKEEKSEEGQEGEAEVSSPPSLPLRSFIQQLDNVGSMDHVQGGLCKTKRCYWAHTHTGCAKGWLCKHCHYCCPPLRADREEKDAFYRRRFAREKEKQQQQQQKQNQQANRGGHPGRFIGGPSHQAPFRRERGVRESESRPPWGHPRPGIMNPHGPGMSGEGGFMKGPPEPIRIVVSTPQATHRYPWRRAASGSSLGPEPGLRPPPPPPPVESQFFSAHEIAQSAQRLCRRPCPSTSDLLPPPPPTPVQKRFGVTPVSRDSTTPPVSPPNSLALTAFSSFGFPSVACLGGAGVGVGGCRTPHSVSGFSVSLASPARTQGALPAITGGPGAGRNTTGPSGLLPPPPPDVLPPPPQTENCTQKERALPVPLRGGAREPWEVPNWKEKEAPGKTGGGHRGDDSARVPGEHFRYHTGRGGGGGGGRRISNAPHFLAPPPPSSSQHADVCARFPHQQQHQPRDERTAGTASMGGRPPFGGGWEGRSVNASEPLPPALRQNVPRGGPPSTDGFAGGLPFHPFLLLPSPCSR